MVAYPNPIYLFIYLSWALPFCNQEECDPSQTALIDQAVNQNPTKSIITTGGERTHEEIFCRGENEKARNQCRTDNVL